MRYGISIPNFAEATRLVDVARTADGNGWDGFFLWDHIVVDPASPPPISEPWTVLAAAAMVTSRVRLGSLVTPVARRRPWVLARQVATVDHLSDGRAVLGVGLGVPPEAEYAPFGESADPRHHGALLDEALDVIDAVWSGEPVDHDGTNYEVRDVRFLPRPVQQPRVPIWSAASLPSQAGVRRGARWDGVAPMVLDGDDVRPLTPDEVAEVVADISQQRSTDTPFDVVVWTIAPTAELRQQYAEAGATWLIDGPAPGPNWHDDAMHIAAHRPTATS